MGLIESVPGRSILYYSLPVRPNYYLKNSLFFSSCIRMSGNNMNFGDKNIKKSDFCKNKKVIKIDNIDVNKILVSKEGPYGSKNLFKCFIGYNDNDVARPLCITLKVTQQFLLRLVTNNC